MKPTSISAVGRECLPCLDEKPNLVVLQTLSKAWGLAGIRLGMLFAHPDLVQLLSRVKYPYNINSLSLREAMDGLKRRDQALAWVKILEERDRLAAELASMDLDPGRYIPPMPISC